MGALARFNNNAAKLNDRGRAAAEALGLKAPCYNPYANNFAQTVEIAHCFEEAVKLIDQLLKMDLSEATLAPNVRPKAGRGVASITAVCSGPVRVRIVISMGLGVLSGSSWRGRMASTYRHRASSGASRTASAMASSAVALSNRCRTPSITAASRFALLGGRPAGLPD